MQRFKSAIFLKSKRLICTLNLYSLFLNSIFTLMSFFLAVVWISVPQGYVLKSLSPAHVLLR